MSGPLNKAIQLGTQAFVVVFECDDDLSHHANMLPNDVEKGSSVRFSCSVSWIAFDYNSPDP